MKKSELKNIFEELAAEMEPPRGSKFKGKLKIYKNPNSKDLDELLKNQTAIGAINPKKVRFIIDHKENNVYVFSADALIHHDVIQPLKLPGYTDSIINVHNMFKRYVPGVALIDGSALTIKSSDAFLGGYFKSKEAKINLTHLANVDYKTVQKYFYTDVQKWVRTMVEHAYTKDD